MKKTTTYQMKILCVTYPLPHPLTLLGKPTAHLLMSFVPAPLVTPRWTLNCALRLMGSKDETRARHYSRKVY